MEAGTTTIECPRCHDVTKVGPARCPSCGHWFGTNDATVTDAGIDTNWSRATRVEGPAYGGEMSLQEGSILGERYEIIKLLGEGGMGAVYKARDKELDRLVALKVIRPELAGHPSVLQRFKQELILARKVTHRNVIRIFDLGVAQGVRFITMEFVEGQDLSHVLEERGRIPAGETVKIIRQVIAALEAAHSEGVVHRDLKPQNIMLEPTGRACVMDFGLARSVETTGLTQAGAVMGTPAYMSPEQAKGEVADERSDLFSLGIIAYQMLTGKVPFKAENALASMLLRTQGPPQQPIEIESTIPQAVNDIVMKMLAIPIDSRYQKAADLELDLREWQQGTLSRSIVLPPLPGTATAAPAPPKSSKTKWIAIAAGLVLAAGGGYFAWDRFGATPESPSAPVTVLIADFNNHTGDPVFSGTLESTLKLALESASFISAYDRTKMRDLGLPSVETLNESAAQGIAVSQGLNVVVSGALDKKDSGYALSLRAIQVVTGKVLATADESAANKDQVLFAVTKLAGKVRSALGDAESESAQRFAMETLTAASLEAVHEYAAGLDALSTGKNAEAVDHFSKAADLDQNFGVAYAAMASAYHNLGRQQEAEQRIKQAISHIDRMTERERYRTRAFLYLLIGDQQKCVDEYGTLLAKYVSDTGAYNNMAVCLTQLRNLPKALDQVKRAVAILPKRATYHVNESFYSSYAGDFQGGERAAAETLKLNPAYPAGQLAVAFAAIGQEKLPQATAAYQQLEKLKPSDAAAGLGDLAIFEGRYQDAIQLLEKGAAADQLARQPDAAADKFLALGYARIQRGQKGEAIQAAKEALKLSTAVKIRFLAGRIFASAGDSKQAKELAATLAAELRPEPQVYGKILQGDILLAAGDPRAAIKLFTEANAALDTWIGRFDLGRAYLDADAFIEADSEFDRCLKRRGETLALFLDESPTAGFFPPVYYFQGRVREGLKSSNFAEPYKKYTALRGKAGEDPLAADARRRTGQ